MSKGGLVLILCVLYNIAGGGPAKGEIRYWDLSPANAEAPPKLFVFASGLPVCRVVRDDSSLYSSLSELKVRFGEHGFPDLRWELGRSALIFPVDRSKGIPRSVSAVGEKATVLLPGLGSHNQGNSDGYRIFVIEVLSSGVEDCDVIADLPNAGTRPGVEGSGGGEAFDPLANKPSQEFISIPDLGGDPFALAYWDLAIAWEGQGSKETCLVAHDARELLQILEHFGWKKDANRFPSVHWKQAANALIVGSVSSTSPSSVVQYGKSAVVKFSRGAWMGPKTVFVIEIDKAITSCQTYRPSEMGSTVHSIQAPGEEHLREAPSHKYQVPER